MQKLNVIVNKKWFPYLFFSVAFAISILQHYRIFSLDFIGVHTWRQTQTQTVIENFYNEEFNILNPRINDLYYADRIYRMEFPLVQWLIAGLYKIFGFHIIITRLFFFSTTLISVIGIYKLILKLTSQKLISLITAWCFLCSPILFYYGICPMPDNVALCLAIWALYFWITYLDDLKNKKFIYSCIFLCFSILIKLPFIVFAGMYLAKAIPHFKWGLINWKYILIPFLFTLPAFAWYISVIGNWEGNGVVAGLFGNKTSILNLLDYLQHNIVSTLPELLINYASFPLFIIGLYYCFKNINFSNTIHKSFALVGLLCITYFLFELNMITKIHDYYLLPFLPLLFVLIAYGIKHLLIFENKKWILLLLLIITVCPFTAYFRCNERWNMQKPGIDKEYVFQKDTLQKLIPFNKRVVVYGDMSRCISLYYLKRKGWTYTENQLSKKDLQSNLNDKATFLITDCNIDTVSSIQSHTLKRVYKKANLQLYTIK